MTPHELADALKKLCSGFNRSEVDLTPERLSALYDRIGHHRADALADAVADLLCEPSYPSFDAIAEALESVEEAARKQEVVQMDVAAKRFLAGWLPVSNSAVEHAYGRLRLDAILKIMDGASPSEVADLLEPRLTEFASIDGFEREVINLRTMSSWPWAPSNESTWWDRQVEMEQQAASKRERASMIDILKSCGAGPDETWPGWKRIAL